MTIKQRGHHWLLAIACGILVFQLLLSVSILRDRFSLTNLLEVRTPEQFDDLIHLRARIPGLDLSFPTIDPVFAREVRRSLPPQSQGDTEDFAFALRWVHDQLQPGDSPNSPWSQWNPRQVIERSRAGERFWCDGYARLAASAGQVLGLETRVIWFDGHVVVEAFDREAGRWIGADPTVPALLIDPDTGSVVSYAEAALRIRAGQSIDWKRLAPAYPGANVEAALRYQHEVLRRDLLVFVDGETAVRASTGRAFFDWMLGEIHGVRLVSAGSDGRTWKRKAFVGGWALLVLVVACYCVTRRRR